MMICRKKAIIKSIFLNSVNFSISINNKQTQNENNNTDKKSAPSSSIIRSKNQILQANIKAFVQQFQLHADLVKNSPSNFTALFARSCLIANKHIAYQKYYPIIKKSINSNKFKLSPHICTSLVECFGQFKFEGDQNKVIQKLFRYYEENHELFSESQECVFWENYVKIMSQKVHFSLKFINIDRKQLKTLEYAGIKQIVSKSIKMEEVNKKIIKNMLFQNKNQMVITMQKIGSQKEIILRIKTIDNFNKFRFNAGDEQQDEIILNSLISQISSLRKKAKKGWNIFIYGNLLPQQQKKEKYVYTNKKDDGSNLQYIKTQKIQSTFKLNQQFLNLSERLDELRISNRYIKGIFYNSTDPNKRLIDIMPTLILGVGRNNKTLIKYFQKNGKQPSKQNVVINYLTVDQLKQCCGYSKLCQFHWELFQSYIEVQNYWNKKQKEKNEEDYGFRWIGQDLKNRQITKQQALYQVISRTDQMAKMSVQRANNVHDVRFQYEYNKDYKKIYQSIGNYGDELYWPIRPFFNDTFRIMNSIDPIIINSKQQKNVKILLVTQKQNIPHLIRAITSLKYWTVPSLKAINFHQIADKQQLLNQILVSTKRNYD